MSQLVGWDPEQFSSLGSSFDEPDPFAPTPVEPTAIVKPSVASEKEPVKQTSTDIVNFANNLQNTRQTARDELGAGSYDPNDWAQIAMATPEMEENYRWGTENTKIWDNYQEDFKSYVEDNDIPLTQVRDGVTYYLTTDQEGRNDRELGGNYDNFLHGRVSDGVWIDQGPAGTYSTRYVDTSMSAATGLLNNPAISIAASFVPFGQVALTAARAANGQTLHGTDYLSASLSAAKGLGMLQAPVNEAAAADAGTTAMQAADVAGLSNEAATAAGTAAQTAATTGQGFTLFGKALSYNQSVGLLTAASTGDPKSALFSIYGGDLIKGGLNKAGVTSDALAKVGIPAAAFEAALQKTVEKVVEGEELDDALAYGFVDYAKEGGLKNLFDMPESDISFAGIEDLVRDIVRPIGSAATDLANLVEDNLPDAKGLEDFVQNIGDDLSDLDTEAREQLTKLDEGLYDIQSPFSTPEIDLPSIDLPSFSMGGGMLLSGSPTATATTGKIFENELFKFKNKIELTEFGPLNQPEQEVDIEDFLTSPFESAFTTSQRFA